jgi:thiamine biosynthesis lipoprotein
MKKIILIALFGVLALTDCRTQVSPTVLDGFTQGTTYHIVIRDRVVPDVQAQIDTLFARVERSMSLYDPNSLISRLNRNETDTLDRWISECIARSQAFSVESGGFFDITVGPLTAAYGFAGAERTEAPNLDSLLRFVGYDKIRVEAGRLVKADPRVRIDLNAIAQGYAVDLVSRHLDSLGVENYLVEMGGEIFSRGTRADGRAWAVQIDAPVEGNFVPGAQAQAVLRLSGRGLATSGNYRKFYEDASGRKIVHTIDPKTGDPVIRNVLSATLIAPSAAEADMYATLCMVGGLEKAKDLLSGHPGVDAYLVWVDEAGVMQVFSTPGMEIVR